MPQKDAQIEVHTQAHALSVHYQESGVGTPVILLHGHPFDLSMWTPQLSADFPNHRLIAPDLRNFGLTTSPVRVADFSTYAQDTLAFADALNIEKFIAVGLSMGGQIAMELAAIAPHRLLGLVLADTYAPLDNPEKKAARTAAANRIEAEGIKGHADDMLPKLLAASTIAKDPQLASDILAMMHRSPVTGAADALRVRSNHRDYLPVLSSIDIPTLIIVGSEDQFTPVSDAELIHTHTRNAKLIIIEGAGHMPNIEDPEAFNAALHHFVESLSHQ
jgi:pimeloyl-ACP methyl ester carboxylesterase